MDERPEHQPSKPNPPYAAFLVRCWRDGEQWRIVLEDVATRKRRGFSTFEALLDALEASLDERP